MNGAWLHLTINHIPVLGVPFGVGLLAASLWRGNPTLQRAGLIVLILSGISAAAADLTGDGARHMLRQQMGADFPKAQVDEHEQAADFGLATSAILGGASLVALWFTRRGPLHRPWIIVLVIAGLFTTTVLARVADLGGRIRHVEIRSGPMGQAVPAPTP